MPPARLLLAATRPQFLAASLGPVLIGSAWGARAAGRLDVVALVLALLATALVHAASNVYNDVSDELLGTDRANTGAIRPYTGGSGYLQSGALSLRTMRRLALVLAALAVPPGLALAAAHGPAVLALGALGGLLGAAYSLPGLRLAGRGLGEAAIALAFGVLPVVGAAWLQSGRLEAGALLLALPVSGWVAAIILANEIPDAPADGLTGKRTLAVRLGARTPLLHALVQALAALACAVLVLRGPWPGVVLVVPVVLLAAGLAAARDLAGDRAGVARGIRRTLAVHGLGCLALLLLAATSGNS